MGHHGTIHCKWRFRAEKNRGIQFEYMDAISGWWLNPTPLKNMEVSWDDDSLDTWRKNEKKA